MAEKKFLSLFINILIKVLCLDRYNFQTWASVDVSGIVYSAIRVNVWDHLDALLEMVGESMANEPVVTVIAAKPVVAHRYCQINL